MRNDQRKSKAIREFKEKKKEKFSSNKIEDLSEDLRDLIEKWRQEGPLSFVRDAYFIRQKGKLIDVEPFDWQERVLKNAKIDGQGRIKNPVIFLSTPSRQGKSLLARFIFCFELITAPDFKGYFISESRETLNNAVWSELKEEIQASPILSKIISEKDIQRREIKNPYTNGVARILPQKTPIGIRADIMAITELWKLESPDILTGSYLRVSESNGTFLVDSLLPSENSPFRNIMDLADEENAVVELHQGKDAFFLNPNMEESQFKRLRTISLEQDFSTQVLNEGKQSDKGRAFSDSTIENALRPYHVPARLKNIIEKDETPKFGLFLGLDRSEGGKQSDNTILESLAKFRFGRNDTAHYAILNEYNFPGSSGERIKSSIEKESNRIGQNVQAIGLESYQSLDLSRDLEKENKKVEQVEMISPSNPRQKKAFTLLKRLMSENRLWISTELNGLITELKNFGHKGNSFGGLKKDRSGDAKISDDRVYALAWGLWVANQVEIKQAPVPPQGMLNNPKLTSPSKWSDINPSGRRSGFSNKDFEKGRWS